MCKYGYKCFVWFFVHFNCCFNFATNLSFFHEIKSKIRLKLQIYVLQRVPSIRFNLFERNWILTKFRLSNKSIWEQNNLTIFWKRLRDFNEVLFQFVQKKEYKIRLQDSVGMKFPEIKCEFAINCQTILWNRIKYLTEYLK